MKIRLLVGCLVLGLLISTASYADAVCDGVWHWVDVEGTQCLDGTPTGFQYTCFPNLGPNGPLLMYVQPGGACGWDNGQSCYCQNGGPGVGCTNPTGFLATDHFDKSWSCDGQAYGSCVSGDAYIGTYGNNGDPGQTAAFNGPTSPFNNLQTERGKVTGRNWNMVEIPYCSADGHAGDAMRVFPFTLPNGERLVAHFKGYPNITRDLKRLETMFSPSEVALWGASAGGVGVTCNLKQVVSTWPQTRYLFDNSGPSLRDVYEPLLATWGQTIGAAADIDGATVGLTCSLPPETHGWDSYSLAIANAKLFPEVRKAITEDYSDAAVNQFANFFDCTGNGPAGSSCDVEPANTIDSEISNLSGDATFKYFFANGICHAERETNGNGTQCFDVGGQNICTSDCDYDNMIQDGVRFNDWVRAFMKVPGYESYWRNVK